MPAIHPADRHLLCHGRLPRRLSTARNHRMPLHRLTGSATFPCMTALRSLADLNNEATLRDIRGLCGNHHVQQLDVFGSILTDRFDPVRSDLDILVTFQALSPRDYADAWFGLKEDLEALLGREIDLVTANSLKNPYFRREVETTRRTVFVAT